MSDTIVGLSVLQKTWVPGIYRLWFDGQKGDGSKSQGNIFIKENGVPGLPDKMPDYPDGCNSIWKFTRNGTKLDCFPSVNWISWGFHNGYNWSTQFVEMKVTEQPYDPKVERPREEFGHAIHYDLNRLAGMNQQEMTAELRQSGVLV